MAFSSILRRSASSFAPIAVRSQRNCHSAVFTALNQTRVVSGEPRLSPFLPPPRSYSMKRRSSDENLVRFLDLEIQCAEKTVDHSRVEEAPGGFPFKIKDDPGLTPVILSREYQGECIEVEVSMPERVTGKDGGDDNQGYDDEKANQSCIPLIVSITKGNGLFIEIDCTAYPDKILISRLAAKNPEFSEEQFIYTWPDPQDMDENMRKAFHEYLEIRGITPSTTNFLHEYMINKYSRKYLMGLKILKDFVALLGK